MKVDEMLDNYHHTGLLIDIKQKVEVRREEFLKTDFLKIRKELGFKEYFNTLILYYQDFALFPDAKTIDKFVSLGLKKETLIWFIPYDEILQEIQRIIATEKIKVFKYPLFILINYYLHFKITSHVLINFGLVTKVGDNEIPMSHKFFLDIYRRRNYSGGTPKTFKGETDYSINSRIDEFETFLGKPSRIKKEVLELSGGGVKNFCLTKMISYFIPDDSLSEIEFCNEVYDFFRIIMKDDAKMYDDENIRFDAPPSYRSPKLYRHKRIKDLFLR